MIWKKETNRFIVEIIATPNWKDGEPINPNIPKWIVKVTDKFTEDDYCPTDVEFHLLMATMNEEAISLLSNALKMKEKHNRANLRNPEKRPIETQIHKLARCQE